MSFKIGDIVIKHNIVVAPMAGVTTPEYMKICEAMDAGYAVSELISAEAVVRNNEKTLNMLKGIEKLKMPVAIQIFGANPTTMAKAARKLVDLYHIKMIDINMGCPVPKVALKNGAGSALLRDPEKAGEIVRSVVQAVTVPVTVKIRSGWDNEHINAVLIAKICEEAGAKAIAIHARTRAQGYSGKADWQIIKEVVENVHIPVIGNGDVTSCFLAQKMLDETHCAAVMIGRGLLGNPWLIKECCDYIEKGLYPKEVKVEEKIKMMQYHLEQLIIAKGEKGAILEMRSHFLAYIKGLPNNKEIKNALCQAKSKKEINVILDNYVRQLRINSL